MIVVFLLVIAIIAGYWVITNIIDAILLGRLLFRNTDQCVPKQYFTVAANRIDIQTGFQCSAFASAYVLRSFGIEVDGAVLYASMPHKMKSGYVYPKGMHSVFCCAGIFIGIPEAFFGHWAHLLSVYFEYSYKLLMYSAYSAG